MSGAAPIDPGASARFATARPLVRAATHEDVAAVAAAVGELLIELGGTAPSTPALEDAARALLDDGDAGALLVAETGGEVVGVLGVSWQIAMRIPGRYGLIQELWVHPTWRKRAIGAKLLTALLELARERQVTRIEVGLPSTRFRYVEATTTFYLDNGFTLIGARMKRLVS